jgi:class 3 adenylate cyclase
MDDVPETRYARSGDIHLAYQVLGSGPLDLVIVPDWFTNLENAWEYPPWEHCVRRLARFSRVILYDQRGSGLSDPISLAELPSLEQAVDDLRVVLDAVAADRPALFGRDLSGPVCMLFAAGHPDRTSALVLFHTYARLARAPDHPIGIIEAEAVEEVLAGLGEQWGRGSFARLLNPSLPDDAATRARAARAERRTSPGAAMAFTRMAFETDVRPALSAIQAPTLVLQRRDNQWVTAAHGRHLAEHVKGARYVELPGNEHDATGGDTDAWIDEVEEFLTGVRPAAEPERVLATVLFTDIVASTQRQSAVGDRRWKELLDRHDQVVRRQLERFRGHEVKTTGDGMLATFDGPARALRCAVAVRDAARQLGLEVRAGLHTGEIEMRDKGDITGVAVTVAARVEALAAPGEVLASRTVVDLVAGSVIQFEDRGENELKGVRGTWRLFSVRA